MQSYQLKEDMSEDSFCKVADMSWENVVDCICQLFVHFKAFYVNVLKSSSCQELLENYLKKLSG